MTPGEIVVRVLDYPYPDGVTLCCVEHDRGVVRYELLHDAGCWIRPEIDVRFVQRANVDVLKYELGFIVEALQSIAAQGRPS